MKLKHHDIDIPKEEGTDPFENCKLERKPYAEVLTSIVATYAEGFVLAIDNAWGTGKTTFIKMWRQHLINEGYQTLYFNAWENDFQEEVIIALLSELQELKPDKGKAFDNLLEKTATFMKKVGPAVIKGAISKALGDEATADIAGAVMEYTSEQVEEQLVVFNEKKKGIEDFRILLEKYVKEVDPEKPVIFFIDELDRCRPSYAVEVLEQVKHLFSVPGIVFVLSIDKKQLGNSIRGFYGSESIDAEEYLRRFIDLEYGLPHPTYQHYVDYLYNYFAFDEFFELKGRIDLGKLREDGYKFKKFAYMLFHHTKLSLRQVEKLMSNIRVSLSSFKENQYVLPQLFLLLFFLKKFKQPLFNKIRNKELSFQELVNNFEDFAYGIGGEAMTIETKRAYLFALVLLLGCYDNYLQFNKDIQLFKLEEGEYKLQVSSSLDDSGGNGVMESYYKRIENYEAAFVSLEHLFTKIELLENLHPS